MKTLYIVRGPFGTGKTEFARSICENVVSSWDYYMNYGENQWNEKLKPHADSHCLEKVTEMMEQGLESVAVTNSFSANDDLNPYYDLAEKHGYKVYCTVVDNRDISEYKKNVPAEIVSDQAARLKGSIGMYNLLTGQKIS